MASFNSQPCKTGPPSFPLAGENTEVQRGSPTGRRWTEGQRQSWDLAPDSLGPEPMLSKVTVPPGDRPAQGPMVSTGTCISLLLRPL